MEEVEESCPICGSHSIPCDCGDDDVEEGDYEEDRRIHVSHDAQGGVAVIL